MGGNVDRRPWCWQLQALILFREVIDSFRGVCRGGGRAPLSGSFQPYPGDSESDDLETFAVYRDVVVIPADGDQIVRIGLSTVGPGEDMMYLEPITERAAFHGAASITVEDMTSEFPAHGPGSASQIERFVLGATDQIHIPVAEDLFEGARSHSRTSKDGNTTLPAGLRRRSGVDDYGHIDRRGLFA